MCNIWGYAKNSTFQPVFGIACFSFYFRHVYRYILLTQCSFNFYLAYYWYWVPFIWLYILKVYIFFCVLAFQAFCHFKLDCLLLFSLERTYRFKRFVRNAIWKYFFPFSVAFLVQICLPSTITELLSFLYIYEALLFFNKNNLNH